MPHYPNPTDDADELAEYVSAPRGRFGTLLILDYDFRRYTWDLYNGRTCVDGVEVRDFRLQPDGDHSAEWELASAAIAYARSRRPTLS